MTPAGFAVVALVAQGLLAAALLGRGEPPQSPLPSRIVFVCQHGNVKSLIASRWFDRLAAARGLAVRSVSRGIAPEVAVPAAIAEQLRRDGFDVGRFAPPPFVPADVGRSVRVVLIGVQPPAWAARADAPQPERWDAIPPATERYDASRDALRGRIVALLDELAGRGPQR